MKLGIMQPYFFPYLGYFELVFRCDLWIIFDTAQYIRHGWVNRNRILHPTTGWQYIIVPLRKHSRESTIREIETAPIAEWRPRILGQLMHYRKTAPYFAATFALVEQALADSDTNLSRLNTRILGLVCAHLEIPWRNFTFSDMNLALGPVDGPGDWALRISEALGASAYLNPSGGEALFDRIAFNASGITLEIQPAFQFNYPSSHYQFEPRLSVIDALMWNHPEQIRAHFEARARTGPDAAAQTPS